MGRKGLTGHVEHLGNGRHRITISTGRKLPNGKYERYRETFHGSDEEADNRRLERLYQMGARRFEIPSSETYGEFLYRWLRHVKAKLEADTYKQYKAHVKNRLVPKLGDIPIKQLTPLHVDVFYDSLQEDGARLDGKPGPVSAATMHRIHAVLNQSLKYAASRHVIPFNPAANVELPKERKPKKRVWTAEQIGTFMAAVQESPHRALVLTLAYTGCRISEVLALKWSDVDFGRGVITVDESLKKDRSFGDTKSHTIREVTMDAALAAVLKRHKAKQDKIDMKTGRTWNVRDLVFPSQVGTPLFYTNFYHRIWKPLVETAGVPYINPHGSRHTFATIMLGSGADQKAVSELLGHHSVAFTMDQYYHPGAEEHREAVSLFSKRVKRG